MPTDITVEERGPQPAMTIRTRTDGHKLLDFLAGTFSSIAAHVAAEGGQIAGPPFAIYHNMNFDDWDVEAGYPVAGEVAGRDDIGPSELPGGMVATCIHTGSYDDLSGVYEGLNAWIRDNGYEAAGPVVELYLNDPRVTQPADLQTQVVFPLNPQVAAEPEAVAAEPTSESQAAADSGPAQDEAVAASIATDAAAPAEVAAAPEGAPVDLTDQLPPTPVGEPGDLADVTGMAQHAPADLTDQQPAAPPASAGATATAGGDPSKPPPPRMMPGPIDS